MAGHGLQIRAPSRALPTAPTHAPAVPPPVLTTRQPGALPPFEVRLCAVRIAAGVTVAALGLLTGENRAVVIALGALLIVFTGAALYEHLSGVAETDPKLVTTALFVTDAVAYGLLVSLLEAPPVVGLAVGLVVTALGPRRRDRHGALLTAGLFVLALVGGRLAISVHLGHLEEVPAALGGSVLLSALLVAAAAFLQWEADALTRMGRDRRLLEAGLADRKSTESDSAYQLERLLDSVSDGVITLNSESRIVAVNPRAARLLDAKPEELIGREMIEFVQEADADSFAYFLWANISSDVDEAYFTRAHETRLRRFNGDILTVELRVGELAQGEERLFACDLRDVSDQKARMEVLEYRAMHDPLTGLPNRALFTDRLRNAISVAARQGSVVGLLLLDLDGFKEINDSLGHHCGDQLLRQVTDRLLSCVRDSDTVGRLGGDEFAVIAPDAAERGSTRVLAERLRESFQTPFILDGRVARISASIGIALCPEHATEDVSLLRQADVAMYVAKAEHLGSFVYTEERDEHSAQRMMRLAELNNAIIRDELVIHYQPKVAIATGEVVGVEALVRWQHPSSGLVFPDDFIPLVEGTELMWPMTEMILRKALTQAREWQLRGLDLAVSVNLSAGNLSEREVGNQIGAILAEVGLPAARLTIEVTESSLMAEGAAHALSGIRSVNVGLSADDFGTGFSSLTALKAMPLTELKIDKSFVLRMDQEVNDAAIVGPIVELGHKRGLAVVAEGVENPEIFQMLADFKCDMAQGYYIAKPMAAWDLDTWMRDGRWHPRLRNSASPEIPAPGEAAVPLILLPAAVEEAPAAAPEAHEEAELTPHEKAMIHLFQPPPVPVSAPARTGRRAPGASRRAPRAPHAGRRGSALPAPSPAVRSQPVAADPDAIKALRRRQRSTAKALEAIIAFVDGPPRRVHADACAAAVVRAVPRRDRGPQLIALLEAVASGEAPGRLQRRAEDAGVELALVIRGLNVEASRQAA